MYNWLFLFNDPLAQVSPFFYLIDISLFIPFGLLCLSASEGKSPTLENEVRALLFQLSIHLLELSLQELLLLLFVLFKSFFG